MSSETIWAGFSNLLTPQYTVMEKLTIENYVVYKPRVLTMLMIFCWAASIAVLGGVWQVGLGFATC